MKTPLIKRIFPFEEPPRKEVRVVFFLTFALFFCIAITIAVTSLIPEDWENRVETTIQYTSIDWIESGEFGGFLTAEIQSTNGLIFKIDSLLTRRMDVEALESFLFRAGEVTLTTYQRNWVIGIEAHEIVFLDVQESIRIIERNDWKNITVSLPFFTVISGYFLVLGLGTNKVKSMFHLRRKPA
jgi:hypothetical protein